MSSRHAELLAWRELHRRATTAFQHAVDEITDPEAATPAGAWNATDVIAHIRAEHGGPEAEDLSSLQALTLDLAVHSWDLAVSQGHEPQLDEELCTALHETFSPYTHLMAQDGAFAPPLPVDDDASARERLIAMCGRDPLRSRG